MKRKTKETPEQKAKRLERNRKARERHWLKTGVSVSTVNWMKERSWL